MITATTTHATLLARLADGADTPAWNEFCARYGDLIRGFAYRRGLQPADSDDILQDVLLKLTRSMPGFTYDPGKGRFRSYLKTVVLHAIFDRLSQNPAGKPVESVDEWTRSAAGDADVDELWEVEWRRYHVRNAMRAVAMEFSAKDVAAFQAYGVDGRGARETADEMGLSVDQIYQAKSQILKRLCQIIKQQTEAEG